MKQQEIQGCGMLACSTDSSVFHWIVPAQGYFATRYRLRTFQSAFFAGLFKPDFSTSLVCLGWTRFLPAVVAHSFPPA